MRQIIFLMNKIMVVDEYRDLYNIRIYWMLRYVYSFKYPLKSDRPFIFTRKYINPILKLVRSYLNISYDENISKYLTISFITHDEAIGPFHIYELLLKLIPNDKLYEVCNYVMANFKPDYKYEDDIYEVEKRVIPYVKSIPDIDKLRICHKNIMNIVNIVLNTNLSVYAREKSIDVFIYPERSGSSILKLASITAASAIVNGHFDISPREIGNIVFERYGPVVETPPDEYVHYIFEVKSDHSKYATVYNYEKQLIIQKDLLGTTFIPMTRITSAFVEILNDLDERTLHKAIIHGIDNEDISMEHMPGHIELDLYELYENLISIEHISNRNMTESIAFYYISKHMSIPFVYDIDTIEAYMEILRSIIKKDLSIWLILHNESKRIMKYFHYGDDIHAFEFIIIKIQMYLYNRKVEADDISTPHGNLYAKNF